MKIFFFLFSITLFMLAGFRPLTETILSGLVTDGDTHEPLIGATIKVSKNHSLVKATISDVNGKYSLQLEPGTYEVEFSYTGYSSQRVNEVKVPANETTILDASLGSGAVLQETVVVGYQKKAVKDEIYRDTAPSAKGKAPRPKAASKSSDDKTAPVTYSAPAGRAAKTTTVTAPESGSTDVFMRSSRSPSEVYYIDGVRVAGAPVPPVVGEISAAAPSEIPKEMKIATDDARGKVREEVKEEESTPGTPEQPSPRAGLLTAGEWNDLHNWNKHWLDMLADGEIDQYQNLYGFFPKNRFMVLLTNEQDFPVADAVVQLLSASGEMIWESRTDNTGKTELWDGLFDQKATAGLRAVAIVDGQKHDLGQLKPAKDGLNRQQIRVDCQAPKNVDIVWAVDATGSMGDEIEYLKTELLDVIGRAKSHNPELAFRMGTVFYRDQGDEYLTKSSGLSPDIAKTVEFIGRQFAGGGGDYPEAVHTALEEAIFNQKWSENAIARICFLVLDASPHQSPEVNASLQRSIREAARLGIRIVPVTASGIQKDTEFLMKFFGLATNGTYVFLTDHSGIGGKHIEPTTDEYKVELLNDLLVRLITEYTTIKTCSGQSAIRFEDPQVQPNQQPEDWQALYYPNPASTQFTLELPFDVQSVTIYNAEGQAVRKLEKPQAGQQILIVSDLAPGFYTIRILKDGRMQSGKLMVVRD